MVATQPGNVAVLPVLGEYEGETPTGVVHSTGNRQAVELVTGVRAQAELSGVVAVEDGEVITVGGVGRFLK